MAFNKAQTSTLAKTVIVAFGIILIIGLAGPSITGLFSIGDSSGDATTAQGLLDQIALRHQSTVTALEGMLASSPESSTILVQLGHTYFDWGAELQGTPGVPVGADRPYWGFATTFYERAMKIGVDGPEVRTDLAVAYFYSGNIPEAVRWVDDALAVSPGFPTALYNAGIFHHAAGDLSTALEAFRAYVEADAEGTMGNLQVALDRITELEGLVGTGTSEETTAQ